MSRNARLVLGTAMSLGLCVLLACSASVGVGGGVIVGQFTIGGKTFTFSFGTLGRIVTTTDQTARMATQPLALFDSDPTDTPPSGQMTLPSSSVGVFQRAAKAGVRSQSLPLNGSATIRILIASGYDPSPCDTGVLMAQFDLVYTSGVPAILNETYDLSAQALQIIASNNVAICIEITADFVAEISLGDWEVSFGGGESGAADFTLRNIDTFENIHILLPGEDFDISNRLTPGSQRTATLTGLDIGDTVNVRAGRNGTVLNNTDCPTVTGDNYQATVEWDGFIVSCAASQDDDGGGVTPGTIIQVPVDSDGGFASVAPVTATYSGVDYGIVAVLYDQTPDTDYTLMVPNAMSVDLSELGLETVQTIYMVIHSSFVGDLPNGVDMGTLEIDYAEGGSPTMLDFVLGSNTAEWAYDRPELAPVPHSLVPTLYTFPTTIGSAFEYDGREYALTVTPDSSRTISCITLTIAPGSTYAAFRDPGLASATWASQYVAAMTFEGPAGTPALIGDCLGDVTTSSDDTGDILGTVIDAETGDPVFAAAVFIAGVGQILTNADGEFTFLEVTPGTMTILVNSGAHQETSVNVVVTVGLATQITIELEPVTTNGGPGTVMSTFDTDDDGWLVYGDAEEGTGDPDYNASGGNPGGYLSATDDVQGGTWYWRAPDKFHGDFSAAYGQTFTFDLKQSGTHSQFDSDMDVGLTGGGITVLLTGMVHPGTEWTAYSFVLSESGGWLRDGNPATQADMMTVLSNLSDILIRGEYIDGADTGSLDNVVLHAD